MHRPGIHVASLGLLSWLLAPAELSSLNGARAFATAQAPNHAGLAFAAAVRAGSLAILFETEDIAAVCRYGAGRVAAASI